MKRFPNLDALRFIAAALVVIGHTEQKKGYLNFKSYFTHFPEVFQLSELSVTFFFVLSGFLITYLIINDIEKQKYSIKTFYKKRIFRIWPLYYLIVLLGLFVIPNIPFLEYHTEHIGNINELSPEISRNLKLSYLLFVPHIAVFFDVVSYLAHTWSIGSEEQFYLIWPILVKIFHKRIIGLCIFFIASIAVIKGIAYQADFNILFAYLDISRMNAMITGGLFAMIYRHKDKLFIDRIYQFLTNKWMEGLSIILVLVVFLNHQSLGLLKHDLFSMVSALLILNAATRKSSMIGLERSSGLSYLGRISYGIYMYHPIIIGICLHSLATYTDKYLASFKSNLVLHTVVLLLTIIVSSISYELVESKLIRLARAKKSV